MASKIGFYDVDNLLFKRRKDKAYIDFPNYALMKLAMYHVQQGDSVSLIDPMFSKDYDKIYASSVFTWSEKGYVRDDTIKGGTGFGLYKDLSPEIDDLDPYYDLYGFNDYAIGFTTRGCKRKCEFCVVPRKEGNIKPYWTVERIVKDRKKVVLFDNNILASEHGIQQIEQIVRMGLKVDFNQGLDSRLITKDVAKLLSKVKYIKYIRTALDHDSMMKPVEKAVRLLHGLGVPLEKIVVYILTKENEIDNAIQRTNFLRKLSDSLGGNNKGGIVSWVCAFINPWTGKLASRELTLFARWNHNKMYFYTMTFEEYKKFLDLPRK